MISENLFLHWHEMARGLAVGLLLLLSLFVLLEYHVSRSPAPFFRWLRGLSLRTVLTTGVILVGVVPAAALVILLSERSAQLREQRLELRVEEAAAAVAFAVDRNIDKNLSGIVSAASAINAAEDFGSNAVAAVLLRHHRIYDDFLTLLGTDEDGNIIAATSAMDGQSMILEELAGFSVADRDYFINPMKNGFPFVSQAFRGRGLGADPIVAISASLRDGAGKRVGIVEGSLNLRAFGTIDDERPHLDGADLILLDGADRVIYASPAAGLDFLEVLATDPLVTASRDVRQRSSFAYQADSQDFSSGHIGAYATTRQGWRAFVRVPTGPIVTQMVGDYRVGGLLLVLVVVVSLLLSAAFVRLVSASLRQLDRIVVGFNLEAPGTPVHIPQGTPQEFLPVFQHFQERSDELKRIYTRLQHSIESGQNLHKELTRTIAKKEVEIAERTKELERLNAELSSQSKRDPLTKIANRREFEAFEKRVWMLGAREKAPVAVVLIDIDHFKLFNDHLGHQAGDDCLVRVAAALKDCARRPLDLVARYGGEEFVAVLGGAAVADALIVAENMRKVVLDLAIDHPGSPHGIVTVSVGAASEVPDAGRDAASLVKAADEALYHAKSDGRNRVVFRRDDRFVTYDPGEHSLDSTNIIRMLAGDRHRSPRT